MIPRNPVMDVPIAMLVLEYRDRTRYGFCPREMIAIVAESR